jgi:NADPH2:quinone reductase
MKAIQISETGGHEVLIYKEVEEPKLSDCQALLDIKAIGVNYTDVYTRTGMTPSELPVIPGVEAAGIVLRTGNGVTEVTEGDLVSYTGAMGSYAERAVVPSWRLVKVPDGLSAESSAAAMLQGSTAHYLSHTIYPIGEGDTCLVHAGAGGVGLLLIQMAKTSGGRVIATVSTDEKATLAKEAGADHVIIYSREDFLSRVMQITDNKGLEVVYDAVGATTFEQSIGCLKQRGIMVLYGQASGHVPPISPSILNPKSLFLTRPSLAAYTSTRDELLMRANDVLGWVKTQTLHLRIHDQYNLKDAAEAHRQLEGRLTTGKLLLIP